MAFSDQVDWSSIAILLHFKKIDRLPKLVSRTNVEVRAQRRGGQARVACPASGKPKSECCVNCVASSSAWFHIVTAL